MSYQATVFKVMIASPSDVKEEREIFREVIAEWNVLNADSRKVVLLPVGWETHSYSEMGDRPQAIINKQILKDCDLVVGVFKTRVGTSTGKYNSGTIEEIEEHVKAKKPAMLYFGPISRENYSSEQFEKLEEFRKSCEGLYCDYKNEEDFRKQFQRELSLRLNSKDFSSYVEPIVEYQSKELKLTKEAKLLLAEAADNESGTIYISEDNLGKDIHLDGKSIICSKDNRKLAPWLHGLEELVENKLIKSINYSNTRYEVTYEGYEYYKLLKPYIIELSKEAQLILKKAANANDAEFIVTRLRPYRIIIGGNVIFASQDGRTIANWYSAVDELEDNRLIENKGGFERNLYMLTREGYKAADLIDIETSEDE